MIYVVCQTGNEDADVMEMLKKYQALSSKIQVNFILFFSISSCKVEEIAVTPCPSN